VWAHTKLDPAPSPETGHNGFGSVDALREEIECRHPRVSWVSHVHGPYPYPVMRRRRSYRSSVEECGTPPRVNRLDSRARGSGGRFLESGVRRPRTAEAIEVRMTAPLSSVSCGLVLELDLDDAPDKLPARLAVNTIIWDVLPQLFPLVVKEEFVGWTAGGVISAPALRTGWSRDRLF
jgi:hypothetical protein